MHSQSVTTAKDWAQLWTNTGLTAQEKLILALLLLNGLSVAEIQTLTSAQIDLEQGWITTAGGRYPLVEQVSRFYALLEPTESSLFVPDQVSIFLAKHGISEEDAQRKLAGALWITSEDTRLITAEAELSEVPILPLRFTFPFSVVERLQAESTPDIVHQSRMTLQASADWLERELLSIPPATPLRQRLIHALFEGKTVFLIAGTSVNGINMIFNLVMGRLLSPGAYSQLALLVTLHLVIGLLPGAAQTAVARFSAVYIANGDLAGVIRLRRDASRLMWRIGIVLSILIIVASPLLARVFQLDSPALLIPLGLGGTFYIVMSIDRGILQGVNGFYWLGAAYLTESLTRFFISLVFGLILLDPAARLQGGAWAVGESMLATWFITWLALRHLHQPEMLPETPEEKAERQKWLRLAGLTLVALIGQALIANSDFLLVKSLFSPEDSGLYAAVSILGRIVYFGALPLTIVLVPFIARKQALNEPTRPVFFIMLAAGGILCTVLILATLFFGPLIVRLLYGAAYTAAAPMLPIYTLAASLYVITNLVVTYRVALGRGSETWIPLAGGIAQVVGILLFHQTLVTVILVQVVLMGILLAITLWRGLRA